MEKFGIDKNRYEFSPTLARGLDYYTGIILEVEVEEYPVGSLGGGGRYDKLVGMFSGQDVPAVGFAFGFDRCIEAMEALNLFPDDLTTAKVLVTVFTKELIKNSIDVADRLHVRDINAEIYLDPEVKLEKQLKYADQKGIPYVIIIGDEEVKSGKVVLKDLKNRTQEAFSLDEVINKLTQ